MTKERFEFEVGKATEGYREFDYEAQKVRYIPYEELKRDKKKLAKLLKKEMHKFTGLWNKSLISEEVLKELTKTAKEAGLEIKPINDLVKNTIQLIVKEREDGSNS